MNSGTTTQSGLGHRLASWLDAMPHPNLALEVSPERVAAARWSRGRSLDAYTVETLPPGALVPSAIEPNVANPAALRNAFAGVVAQIRARGEDVALLLPDPVIRVFVQHFDEFPRSAQEADPMLRWKLKKSVPFDVDETVISYMRQPARQGGVDVVTALARQRIIREYEGLAEGAGLKPGVVMSSALASISLLDGKQATLLVRLSGTALTAAIVRENLLCGFRCTELPAHSGDVTPQTLLEEIFPLAAYYQDIWHEGIQSVRIAGLGGRLPEFVAPLEAELRCSVNALLHRAVAEGRIQPDAQPLADREIDGLVGWMLHRN